MPVAPDSIERVHMPVKLEVHLENRSEIQSVGYVQALGGRSTRGGEEGKTIICIAACESSR